MPGTRPGMTSRKSYAWYKTSRWAQALLALRRPLRKLDDVPRRGERARDQRGDALAALRRDLEAHAFGFPEKRRLTHGRIEGLPQRLDAVRRHARRRHQRPPELRIAGKEGEHRPLL